MCTPAVSVVIPASLTVLVRLNIMTRTLRIDTVLFQAFKTALIQRRWSYPHYLHLWQSGCCSLLVRVTLYTSAGRLSIVWAKAIVAEVQPQMLCLLVPVNLVEKMQIAFNAVKTNGICGISLPNIVTDTGQVLHWRSVWNGLPNKYWWHY